jgi:hypothetical protein
MAPRLRPLLTPPNDGKRKQNRLYLRAALKNGAGHPEPIPGVNVAGYCTAILSRVIFAVVGVSSRKTSRCGCRRIRGWRRWVQTWRSRRTGRVRAPPQATIFLYENQSFMRRRDKQDGSARTPCSASRSSARSGIVMTGRASAVRTRWPLGHVAPSRVRKRDAPGGRPPRGGRAPGRAPGSTRWRPGAWQAHPAKPIKRDILYVASAARPAAAPDGPARAIRLCNNVSSTR